MPLFYIQLLPVFVISTFFAFWSIFLPQDESRRRFCGLIALNCAAMTALVCSNNLAQLLTCICMADIISVMLIKNILPAKKYIFYSLFADMGLMVIFAMLQGKLRSFNLDTVLLYNQEGRHKDFVAIAILLFSFIKVGLFMFQGSLLDLKNTKSSKILFVVSVSGVLSGIFSFMKLYPLLQISSYSLPILYSFLGLSAVCGLIFGIIITGTNQKIVYFNMMLHALVLYMFSIDGQYSPMLSALLICGFFSSVVLSVHKKRTAICLRIVMLLIWLFFGYKFYGEKNFIATGGVSIICLFLCLADYVRFFYKYGFLQKNTFFDPLYDILLVRPVLILGRGLWVMVDFLIMERQFGGSVGVIGKVSTSFVEKMRASSVLVRVLAVAACVLMFAASFYLRGKIR